MYRMLRYITSPYADTEALIARKFLEPSMKIKEEEDNGSIELGYGLA